MAHNEMENQIVDNLTDAKQQIESVKETLLKLRNAGVNVSRQLVRLQSQENKVNRILSQLGE